MTIARPAVFLDRDGTIIEDRGHLRRPDEVEFYPDAFAALRSLQPRFALVIVTNQGGIGQGLITAAEAERLNGHVVGMLAANGVDIAGVYVCPHSRAEGCRCIKPHPHFLLEAARKHGLDLSRSFTVGYHPHDVELADRAGARRGILVLTGHGRRHEGDVAPGTPKAAGIGEAAEIIATYSGGRSGG